MFTVSWLRSGQRTSDPLAVVGMRPSSTASLRDSAKNSEGWQGPFRNAPPRRVNIQKARMAIEIVDLPIKNGDFP